ncbi:MAG: O-antigen ligase family protein [Pseudomonadota bacterium]
MQLSCQSFKNIPFDRYIPAVLIFILCPLVLFFQRYAVVILTLSGIWSISYLRKLWTPLDVNQIIINQIKPKSSFELYLNYGLIFITFFDFFRPYGDHFIELQVCSMLTGGFLWWHALHNHKHTSTTLKLHNFLFYGIVVCCLIIIIDCFCGSLLVASAEKIGKNRALVLSKVGMTISIAIWPVLYNQPFWKVGIFCAILMVIMPILDCDTAIVSLLLSLCAYGIASIESKLFWRFIQAKVLIICLSLPFIFNIFLTDKNIYEINKVLHSYSYIHRLHVWQYTSQKIMERPWVGFGLNAGTQDEVGGQFITKPFYYEFKNGEGTLQNPIVGKQIPNHPHNVILQWWLESGLIGVLWWTALLVFLIEKIRQLQTPARKVAFAFFTSNMMIILFSIGFWQSWWWATWLFLLPLLTISRK